MTRAVPAGDPDIQVEPVRGLPETPPEGERILWQGTPDWRVLARRAFAVRTAGYYFAALATWRAASTWAEGDGLADALWAGFWLVLLGAVTMGLLALMAWVTARAAVYTVTNRRVAMRIGVAFTVTLNLPFRWITGADLKVNPDGSGDIALALGGGTRLASLMLWPHARPWRLGRPEPTIRAVPGIEAVAALLVEAMRADMVRRGEAGVPISESRPAAPGLMAAE